MAEARDGHSEGMARRDFLRTSAAVAAGTLVFGDWTPAIAADLPTRTLGRTGLKVTTISFGAIQLNSAAHARVLEHAIDSGMNLVHVSAYYQNGRAIEVVGQVMRRKRNQVVLCLKDGDLDQCLRTLNTDHVDILVPPKSAQDARNRRFYEQFQQWKQQGKVRFLGFATHDDMAAVITAAAGAGFWDCCLVNYNIGNRAELNPVIQRAVQNPKMGFMVMKASRGLPGGNVAQWQAGLRNLLANTNLTTLTLGMNSIQQVDQNIAAVLQRSTQADFEFERHAAACAGTMCSFCGDCARSCPRGVAVMDYLRAAMYAERGDHGLATELVRTIPVRRSLAVCNDCGLCTAACGRRLAVLDELHAAARL